MTDTSGDKVAPGLNPEQNRKTNGEKVSSFLFSLLFSLSPSLPIYFSPAHHLNSKLTDSQKT